jgi:hypothetical protein
VGDRQLDFLFQSIPKQRAVSDENEAVRRAAVQVLTPGLERGSRT